jgi:hypothetical protein
LAFWSRNQIIISKLRILIILTKIVPGAPDEEDLNVRKLLRLAYSAGPVSPTCFDVHV